MFTILTENGINLRAFGVLRHLLNAPKAHHHTALCLFAALICTNEGDLTLQASTVIRQLSAPSNAGVPAEANVGKLDQS